MIGDDREQWTRQFTYGRISEEAAVVARCQQLGGVVLGQRRPPVGFTVRDDRDEEQR